jgi:polar amino acid transport system substrate-binding protein
MKKATEFKPFLFAITILHSLLFFTGAVYAQEILKIGYWNIPPHATEAVDKQPKGAAIGYFEKYIAPQLGMTIAWDENVTPPTRLMKQLREGQKDAMIFLGYTKDRTEYLRYPDPYLDIPQTFAFARSHPINRITNVSDLHGLRVGFLVGGRLPEELSDDKIQYDLIAGERLFQRNVEKLLAGRIDAIYVPLTIALENILKQMEIGDQVKLVPIEFLDPVLIYTVFSRKTVSAATIEKYNKALKAAHKEQKYKDYANAYQLGSNSN